MANGTEVDEKVKGYDPSTDLLGPANWIPQECFTNVTYKYASPIIATIKQDNQLHEDLKKQTFNIMENQRSIKSFMDELEAFFEIASSAFGTGDEDEDAEAEKEEKKGGPMAKDPDVDDGSFKIPKELNQMAGGPAPNPHPVIPEQLGNFTMKEFDSEEEMFAYI